MRHHRRRAMSLLLEILVGMGILACGVLIAFSLFPSAYNSLGQAKNLAMATNLARQVMEEQKSRDFEDIDTINNTTVSLPVEVNGAVVSQQFVYRFDQTLSADATSRHLTVVVQWRFGSQVRDCRLDTVLCPH